MSASLSLAFIGGGNMASALAAGLIGRELPADRIHVIDLHEPTLQAWRERGASTATAADARLADANVWVYAVKPQQLREVVQATQPFLRDALVISVAAGVRAADLSVWLGGNGPAWPRVVRCMPNTPALVGAGATGLAALPGVSDADRALAERLLGVVGCTAWVQSEADLDAVTALSGSGPAYVFLFLESLIDAAVDQGLSPEVARTLALATLSGATQLAQQSDEPLSVLRERVTSKGGTTAAALDVFAAQDFRAIVAQAMAAAARRAQELGDAAAG